MHRIRLALAASLSIAGCFSAGVTHDEASPGAVDASAPVIDAPAADAQAPDPSAPDAGPDARTADALPPDAGAYVDAATVDAGPADAAPPDTETTEIAPDATFADAPPELFTLSVKKLGSGTGLVTSTDGKIWCGPTCAAAYAVGAPVVLTAASAIGSKLCKWEVPYACGTSIICPITMAGDLEAVVYFEPSGGPCPD